MFYDLTVVHKCVDCSLAKLQIIISHYIIICPIRECTGKYNIVYNIFLYMQCCPQEWVRGLRCNENLRKIILYEKLVVVGIQCFDGLQGFGVWVIWKKLLIDIQYLNISGSILDVRSRIKRGK